MSTSLNGGSKQNNASSSTTEQTSTNTTAGSNSTHLKTEEDKMAEKKSEAIDYSTIGAAVAKTLVSANQLSPAEVKIIQGKIYNLFSGVQPEVVDFTIAAYFCVNDPSPDTDWALSPPVVAGGKSVPIVSILNPTVISVAKGDGKLRKFLSTAYEALVPQVIEHTPGVAEQLSARLAKHGFTHVAPIVAVSWVKGVKVETAQSSGARGLFRDRATVRGDKSAVITDSVSVPTPKTDNKRLDAGQKQTFY